MTSRRILQIGLAACCVLAIVFVAGGLVIRSRAFHRYLLAIVVKQAQHAVGGRVDIGDFTLRLADMRADLYRIAIHGTEPGLQKPLLWAGHLTVVLKLVSLSRRQINLQEIEVDHPVVHFLVNEHGHNNLPAIPPAPPGKKPTSIFDLAVRRFVLRQGEIYYNDLETPLEAELRDFHAQISFDASKARYDGSLAYRQGLVRYGEYNPLEHDLEAQVSATPSGLTLSSLRLASGSSRITAQAHMQDYSNPLVDGSYDVVLATSEVRKLLRNDSLPAGMISTRGTVHYRALAGQPFINSLAVQGRLSSPMLSVETPQARTGVQTLRAEYRLNKGDLEIREAQAEVLGGHVEAQLIMKNLAGTPEAHAKAEVRGLSFSNASAALRTKPPVRIAGHLDGSVNASWRGSMEDLQVNSDATIAARAPVASGPDSSAGAGAQPSVDASALPMEGVVHLTYNGPSGVITLRQTSMHTPHTTVSMEGSVGEQSSLRIQAHSDDLSEIDGLLLTLRTANAGKASSPSKPPQLLGLGGSASFEGQVAGTMHNPRVTGHMSGTNLRYQNVTLQALTSNLDLSPSGVALHQGDLQISAKGRVKFDGTVGLRNWLYTPQDPIDLRMTADYVPVADVEELARMQYPVSGNLSVNLSFHGSQENPAGQGTVRLAQARAWDQPIQDLSVQFQAADNSIHSTLNVRSPAGSGSAKVNYSLKDEAYDAQADFPGIHLDKLQPLQKWNLELTGVVKVSARGRGTVKDPQLEATIEAPSLQFRKQKLDGLRVHVGVARQQATFSVDSTVVGAYVKAQGTVNLNADYDANVTIDTHAVQLGPLLATYLSAPGIQGQTELHGSIKGPLKRPEQLEGQIVMPTLGLNYQSFQIANASPIRIDYKGRTLTLQPAELKGPETDLHLQATVPLGGQEALRATATGKVDLHLIQVMNSQWSSSGQVKVDLAAQGVAAHPDIRGQVQVIDAAFQAPGAPLGADKINGEFDVQGGRVNIKSFSARSGGGTVTARGFAAYKPGVRFDVNLSAQDLRLRYPEGLRAVLKCDLNLVGTPEAAALNGQVLVDGVSFTPAFDLSSFADQFSGNSAPPTARFMQNVKMNVSLKSTNEMSLASSQLSLDGSADLRVAGTLGDPVILGRTQITGGELFFNGLRYQVEHGTIQFANPVSTEPVLNIAVTTTVQQFNINVNLVGPLDRLRTTYTSDPPLASVDIISLLFTGQTTEASAASPSTPQSVVAGQVAGQVSSRLGKMAGISSLTIDPQIGGNQSNPGGSIGIQQRVTKNLYFTFTTDLTNTQGDVVQVEYQITKRYAVSAIATENQGYSLQVKMHKKF